MTEYDTRCIVFDVKTFSDIIDLWPDPAPVTLAQDLNEEPGTVRQWRSRDTLPSRVWRRTVRSAERRRIDGVTLDVMASIAERQAGGDSATSKGRAA